MHSNLKRRLAIGVVVMAAAAFAGGAYAATKDSSSTTRQAFLNDVAKRLHVTPAQLTSALEGAAVDQVDAAVAAGKLTQAQANQLKQRIQSGKGLLRPLGLFPFLGPAARFRLGLAPQGFRGGLGLGPRLFRAVPVPPGPGSFVPPPHPAFKAAGPLAGAASYLGLSSPQLAKELGSGKSLAQIAKAQGKSASGLRAAMISSIKAKLDKAVASKMLTSAQEQRILGRLSTRLGDLINRSIRGFGFAAPGSGKAWGPAGFGPPGPANAVPVPRSGSAKGGPAPQGPAGLLFAPPPPSHP